MTGPANKSPCKEPLRWRLTTANENKAIRLADAADFHTYALCENAEREELGYPPHGRLLRVLLEDESEERVRETGTTLADQLEQRFGDKGVQALGPAPCPIALQRGRHRYHLLVKADLETKAFSQARDFLASKARETSRPHVVVDVEPSSLL